ncbi:MAG: oligopeptide:H+ symporter [Crocinitomicaceae bacterium]|nr:oligopeptide:H+ symporter [Crocinitomicaceae bacterium]MCF8433300.1 oligopeptide:H+ symporter [Crocinitomicaceae bacterium]
MSRKHPKALPFLFFSEMWERFGYYLMIGIFTFYLKGTVDGFGMSEAEASDLYGTFIAFVFLTPFIGGLLADRVLGYRRSITIGGLMMGIGYCLMAVHDINALYAAMLLVILGNGFFKPNISTLLGNLYNDPEYKARKDEGYNIFYMGINIGAFVCNFFGAALYNVYGWWAAFTAAGIGMFIGIIIFWAGTKHFKHVDVIKPVSEKDMPLMKIFGVILLPAIGFGLIGFFLPEPLVGSRSTDAFLLGCIPVVFFYGRLLVKSPQEEKRPIAAMLAIFGVVIAFWAVFKQNGSTLNTWADRYTDREIPSAMLPAMKTFYLVDTIPAYAKDSVVEMDHQFRSIDKTKLVYDFPSYYKNLQEEDCPEPGKSVYAFNANLFQSVNPFWVVALTPLVLAFFGFLRRRGKEPSTPAKIAFGLVISALSCFVMVGAVYAADNGAIKSSAWWFISSYAVITIGELFLSPMGLSMVSKLSPPRLTALMMGGWFLATSIGNKLSGVLSSLWDGYDDKANFFYVNFILLGCAAVLMFAMLKWLNKIFKEHV